MDLWDSLKVGETTYPLSEISELELKKSECLSNRDAKAKKAAIWGGGSVIVIFLLCNLLVPHGGGLAFWASLLAVYCVIGKNFPMPVEFVHDGKTVETVRWPVEAMIAEWRWKKLSKPAEKKPEPETEHEEAAGNETEGDHEKEAQHEPEHEEEEPPRHNEPDNAGYDLPPSER